MAEVIDFEDLKKDSGDLKNLQDTELQKLSNNIQKQLDLDTFAPTNKQFEPVTTGIGGKPRQMDTTRELIVELYNLTGDINLARLLR